MSQILKEEKAQKEYDLLILNSKVVNEYSQMSYPFQVQ